MKRLRQPVRTIREPFGKSGLIVAVVALVFAMLGGAYAANHTGGKATASAKGKRGPRGPKGPVGPEGKQGPAGANGKDGTDGTNGAPGEKGADGTSATTVTIPTSSATCNHNGGVEVKSAGPTHNVCNGTTGFTKTLPSGETETGSWATPVFENQTEDFRAVVPISFSIPLAVPLNEEGNSTGCSEDENRTEICQVHYINFENEEVLTNELGTTESNDCLGTVEEPLAVKGNLCIYEGQPQVIPAGHFQYNDINTPYETLGGFTGAGTTGATLSLLLQMDESELPSRAVVRGTFAVTAP
jgi:collagen triple helix repeat protein